MNVNKSIFTNNFQSDYDKLRSSNLMTPQNIALQANKYDSLIIKDQNENYNL